MKQFDVPILFIIFNKLEKSRLIIQTIKKIEPKILYIAADGPRMGNKDDEQLCNETRSMVLKEIDWECDLHLDFREVNKGCGLGPSSAITWFFSQVSEGIILEDDCLPNVDFFYYCKDLLGRYRDVDKIKSIGGVNFQRGHSRSEGSYYYSKHNAIWGWASWRRVWENYDYYLDTFSVEDINDIIKRTFDSIKEQEYWINIFKEVKANRLHDSCWDYQFMMGIWCSNGIAILPNVNLVTNIGFDHDACHTSDSLSPCSNVANHSILPLKYNDSFIVNKKADLYYFNHFVDFNHRSLYYFERKWKKLKKISRERFHIY